MATVIYDNSNFDVYEEAARKELEESGNTNPTEKELSSEVDFLIRNDWDNVKATLTDFFKTDTWLARGTVGSWYGTTAGGFIFKNFDKLYTTVCQDCDYVKIWDEDGHFHMSGTHHDGTNYVEVVKLSKKGKAIWNDWNDADNDSDLTNYSLEELHKLLAERYSDIPNYAKAQGPCV